MYTIKRETAAAVIVQKYVRRWLLRRAHLQACLAALLIQSYIRGFIARCYFSAIREHKAATLIQSTWRRRKVVMLFQNYRQATVTIQCSWRQKLARKELRRLKMAANEAGALREAKNKLEKKMDDLALRLTLERRLRAASEKSKSAEILKRDRIIESLSAEFAVAKSAAQNEHDRNLLLQKQLDDSLREITMLQSKKIMSAEAEKENSNLKAANEAGALREAKNKLEKKMDDLALRLTLERKLRAASENQNQQKY